jgi:hypothetical protein
MTSRHEDRDGNLNGTFGLRRERRSWALFIHWLRIHDRTLVHSHDCVTSVLSTRSHRCALSKPYFRYSHALLGEKAQGDVRALGACGLDGKRCGIDRIDRSVMFDLYARLRGGRSFWLGLVDKADNGLECARVRKGG